MLEFLFDNIMWFLSEKSSSRQHSNGYELCPSSSQHISVLIRRGIHTVFALNGNERVSILVQSQRNIDDVLSINNPEFKNYQGKMYPAELEIKDTTESTTSASYLDLLLSIGRDCQLHTSNYDKRDDFNFHITNFPFLSSNMPSLPAFGVFISQLIRYNRTCFSYECLFLGPGDFSVSYLNSDTSWNA